MAEDSSSNMSRSGVLSLKVEPISSETHISSHFKFVIGNIKNIIQTPLATETHQIWKLHILKLSRANDFEGYLTRGIPCPPQLMISLDGTIVTNLEHSQWILNNLNLASTLYPTILFGPLPYVLNLNACA